MDFELEINDRLLPVIDCPEYLLIRQWSQFSNVVKLNALVIAFLDEQLDIQAFIFD